MDSTQVDKRMGQETTRDTYLKLSPDLKKFIPEKYLSMYEGTSVMHCDQNAPGGSKFHDVSNILQVLERIKGDQMVARIKACEDDREKLLSLGAPERAFLPAPQGEKLAEGIPNALYYKIEGVEGELRIDKIKNLPVDTKVVVCREKGIRDQTSREYAAASLTAVIGEREFPKVNFATAIFGRDPGTNEDELWTVHPGLPIRPALKDFPWSANLAGPQETDGEKGVIVTTVGKLIESGLTSEDYIKVSHGTLEDVVNGQSIIREI